ncbi:transcriptional regulator with XRE-family HTH domain [Nonomuraea thailandensis]|uniref:Transcriptional regulator with XRE-family HTH domain n=1 Tax=Nonomuraea thailandensis TaxID=1188745 RepID=A0A9X2KAK1_9ACTN|nr:helix-turn-helix transcriptional regulator [Nonomuraea thailandensis]MCP2363041.1 transcriptional regulator with XRE-family HTH domain [Nonomuraea thailandensis]
MAKRLPAPAGIASTVRETREARGLTQTQLGGLVGRSGTHIGTFERGWGASNARVLDAIAFQLGCRWALVPLEEAHDAQE